MNHRSRRAESSKSRLVPDGVHVRCCAEVVKTELPAWVDEVAGLNRLSFHRRRLSFSGGVLEVVGGDFGSNQ